MSDMLAVGEHQHFAEGRGLAGIDIQKIDIHRVAFRDAILPSASLDDCVGHNVFSGEKKPRKFTQNPAFDKRKRAANRQPSPAASRLPSPWPRERIEVKGEIIFRKSTIRFRLWADGLRNAQAIRWQCRGGILRIFW